MESSRPEAGVDLNQTTARATGAFRAASSGQPASLRQGGSRPSVFFRNAPIEATALALAIQVRPDRPDRGGSRYASLTGSLFLLPFVLIYTYGYSAAAAGAAFLPFSAIMAAGSRTAGGLAQLIGSRAMLAAGGLVTASGYAVFALSAERPEYWLGFLPGLALTGIGMTACVAPLTTVVLDAVPCDLGGSASGMNNAAARLSGLVAVAALGFAFGDTSALDVASVAVVEAYRRVM